MKFEVDRALRLALGMRVFPTHYIGVHCNVYQLIPALGPRTMEARMGLDIYVHKND